MYPIIINLKNGTSKICHTYSLSVEIESQIKNLLLAKHLKDNKLNYMEALRSNHPSLNNENIVELTEEENGFTISAKYGINQTFFSYDTPFTQVEEHLNNLISLINNEYISLEELAGLTDEE